MKLSLPKIGAVVVVGLAVTALVVNQTAQAQERTRLAPITAFKSARITSADPDFRYAATAVINPIKQGIDPSQGAVDVAVFSSSVYKDVWTTMLFIGKSKTQKDLGDTRVSRLTPGQLAIAETLFTQVNLGRAKNVEINSDGITGKIGPRELGLAPEQLKQLTVQRLQNEVRTANTAINELQR